MTRNSLTQKRKELIDELVFLGTQLKKLQKEHDNKVKEIHKIENQIEKNNKHAKNKS